MVKLDELFMRFLGFNSDESCSGAHWVPVFWCLGVLQRPGSAFRSPPPCLPGRVGGGGGGPPSGIAAPQVVGTWARAAPLRGFGFGQGTPSAKLFSPPADGAPQSSQDGREWGSEKKNIFDDFLTLVDVF